MSLLPSKPDASPSEDTGPRVIGVDSEDADEVLSALSSETARRLLAEVHDDPAPPSELAERAGTSLQNVQYHLEKLEAAGAVEVVDTAYSAKGREMDVYAAADQPLVIFAGDQEDSSVLRTAIQRLVGALGVLALASLAVQALFGRAYLLGGADVGAPAGGGADGDGGEAGGDGGDAGAMDVDGGDGGGDADADVTGEDAADATETPTAEATPTPEATPTQEPIGTPQSTGTPTPEPAGTPTPQATGTPSPTETSTPEPMATPTDTPVSTETVAPTDTPEAFEAVTQTPTPGVADSAVGTAAGLPPGLLFFAGGAFVLGVVTVAWYLGQ
jgi:DNA-binding transcriptional ArsR family regulator